MTNYFSFIPYPYKLRLIRTLVDRAYKINNTWLGFIWLKGLSIGTSRSPVMSAIPWSPFQTQLLTFIFYLRLALFLLSRKKGFADLLSVIVTTAI